MVSIQNKSFERPLVIFCFCRPEIIAKVIVVDCRNCCPISTPTSCRRVSTRACTPAVGSWRCLQRRWRCRWPVASWTRFWSTEWRSSSGWPWPSSPSARRTSSLSTWKECSRCFSLQFLSSSDKNDLSSSTGTNVPSAVSYCLFHLSVVTDRMTSIEVFLENMGPVH